MVMIAPSILSADFARLQEEIEKVEAAGADWIHVDVMDGRFVPNLTMGPLVVEALKKCTRLPLDVHLMICQPENFIPQFASAGADIITVHPEASIHLHRTLQQIRKLKVKAGVALNPSTPPGALEYVRDELDLVLVMSVNPGFGGQEFISSSLKKIQELRAMLSGLPAWVQVDGGINARTAPLAIGAGADILVAGSAIFSQPDAVQAIRLLRTEKKMV